METAIKTITAVVVLFILSFGINLYGNNSILEQKPSITNAKTNEGYSHKDSAPESFSETSFNGKNSVPKNAVTNHYSNNKSHKEFILWGLKAGDWIALILGFFALFFSWCGLKQNRKSNEKQNRAYVYVEECKLVETDNKSLLIKFKLVNGGATPAHKLRKQIWAEIQPRRQYTQPIPNDCHMTTPSEAMIYLAPNDSKVTEVIDGMITPEHMISLEEGRSCVKLFIRATYYDAFGEMQVLTFKFKTILDGESVYGEMHMADEGLTST